MQIIDLYQYFTDKIDNVNVNDTCPTLELVLPSNTVQRDPLRILYISKNSLNSAIKRCDSDVIAIVVCEVDVPSNDIYLNTHWITCASDHHFL